LYHLNYTYLLSINLRKRCHETGLLATVHLLYDIAPTFQVSLFGTDDWRIIEYKNWFAMFRDNLIEFVKSVQQGKPRLDFAKTENVIRTLIAANENLQKTDKKTVKNQKTSSTMEHK
jgi:hypothetical protein